MWISHKFILSQSFIGYLCELDMLLQINEDSLVSYKYVNTLDNHTTNLKLLNIFTNSLKVFTDNYMMFINSCLIIKINFFLLLQFCFYRVRWNYPDGSIFIRYEGANRREAHNYRSWPIDTKNTFIGFGQ